MRSMTGMGVGAARRQGVALRVELRSVNHRFLDVAFRLPAGMSALEPTLKDLVAAAMDRGRVTAVVELDAGASRYDLEVNEPFVEAFLKAGRRIARRYDVPGEIDLAHITARPEALSVHERALSDKLLKSLAQEAMAQALERFNAMRAKEGKALGKELARRLKAVTVENGRVKKQAPTVPKEAKRRLEQRLKAMGAADSVDPTRLAAEVALLADRANINEECERLNSHVAQFKETLARDEPVAKRLGFLLQEMHREVNTMGSKTSHLAITASVIRMKEEIESMREQIQNLE